MTLPRNCTCGAGFIYAAVFFAFLSTDLSGWARPLSEGDVPDVKSQPHPASIAKEVALANDYLFGRGVAQDLKLAAYWLEKAANAGNPEAQIELGYFYATGTGVTKSMELAAHWYQLAAQGDMAEAKASLGMLYFLGTGVPENKETAAQLFREAAAKGSGMAAYELGIMYSTGVGVGQDLAAAEQWFVKGAKLRNPQAEYELGLLFLNTTTRKPDLHKSEKLLRSSAASGFAPAMHNLGLLLARHPDLAKSPNEAAQFLEVAAEAGIWRSSQVLGILARDGNGVPKDEKAAYFRFRVATLQGGDESIKALQVDLQSAAARLEPTQTSALDAEAQEWYQKHKSVLDFVYNKDGQASYPVPAVATAPKDGQLVLQMFPTLLDEQSIERGMQTAAASRK